MKTIATALQPADAKNLYEGLVEVFLDHQKDINSAAQWFSHAYQINASLYRKDANLNSLYNDLKNSLPANDRKKIRVIFELALSLAIIQNQDNPNNYLETLRHYIAITKKHSRQHGRFSSFKQVIYQIGRHKIINIKAGNMPHTAILISLESCGAIRVKDSYLHQFVETVFSGRATPEIMQAFDFFEAASSSTIRALKLIYIEYFSKNNINIDNKLEHHRTLNSIFFPGPRELLSRALAGVSKNLDDICNVQPGAADSDILNIESNIKWSFSFLRESMINILCQEAVFFIENILVHKINPPGNKNKQIKSNELIRLTEVFIKQIELSSLPSGDILTKALKIGSRIDDKNGDGAAIVAAEIVAWGQGHRFPFRQALAHVILKNTCAKELMKHFEKSPVTQYGIYEELKDEALVPLMSDKAKRAAISNDLGI